MKMHYRACGFGGFTSDMVDIDIQKHIEKFEAVEGDTDSKYAVRLLRSNIARTVYSKMFFSNDLAVCEAVLTDWLSQRYEKEWAMTDHLYGNIFNVKDEAELGYGDAWSSGEDNWHDFNGVEA